MKNLSLAERDALIHRGGLVYNALDPHFNPHGLDYIDRKPARPFEELWASVRRRCQDRLDFYEVHCNERGHKFGRQPRRTRTGRVA